MNARGEKFAQASHRMQVVLPCGAGGSPVSLNFGV